jgi:hypothetical protein
VGFILGGVSGFFAFGVALYGDLSGPRLPSCVLNPLAWLAGRLNEEAGHIPGNLTAPFLWGAYFAFIPEIKSPARRFVTLLLVVTIHGVTGILQAISSWERIAPGEGSEFKTIVASFIITFSTMTLLFVGWCIAGPRKPEPRGCS